MILLCVVSLCVTVNIIVVNVFVFVTYVYICVCVNVNAIDQLTVLSVPPYLVLFLMFCCVLSL